MSCRARVANLTEISNNSAFSRRRFSSLRSAALAALCVSCSTSATVESAPPHDGSVGDEGGSDATVAPAASAPDESVDESKNPDSMAHDHGLSTAPRPATGPTGTAGGLSTTGEAEPDSSTNSTSTRNEGSATSSSSTLDTHVTTSESPTADTETSNGPETGSGPSIQDNTLLVDGAPFRIRGVNWNPVPVGATHPQGLDYRGSVVEDAPLMQAAGINAVRTYEHLADPMVLDALYEHGIYVFTTVYGWWQDDPSVVTERVNSVKDHPAVLGYVLGNEWNYNQLYSNGGITTAQTRDQINAAAALVKQADPSKLVCTIYGELGDLGSMVESMPDIDLWGINAYRGIGFGDLFDKYAEVSTKPMFLGEFGADAYNANLNAYDPDSQAEATSALIGEISAAFADGKTVGGFLFEWNDEWWKDGAGSPNEQDVGGIAPGGGPHPDATFNEEWWGIVDINREPRPAYAAVKAAYAP